MDIFADIIQDILNDPFSFGIYVLAYITAIVAFSLSSMFWLRVMVVLSSALYALYYYIYPADPLWLDIISEGFLAIINLIMIAVLMHQQAQLKFSDEEKLLYEAYFSGVTPFEYVKLMKLAHWETYDAGHILAAKGRKVRHLSFIYDGGADVKVDGETVAEVHTGNFVGEVSFKLNQPATATVVTQQNARVVQWYQYELKELFESNPGMKNCVEALISTDLARKLRPK